MTSPKPGLAEALGDHYTIEREVGAGGMATVYLAHDTKHDRKVAIKVLRPELASAVGTERFPREIRTVAQFNHPHILSLYDSGEAAGFLYYVMPFVEGESLRDRLLREKQLPVADAVRILSEVADALAYSHARGVVHRDIKPANIMLAGRHAIVADFGVAKALKAAAGDTLTTVGIALGTPQYMSPEQAMGQEDVDHRSDIYALGLLGYEMLAGHPPFEGASAQALLAAQVMEMPPDIQLQRPGIPPALGEAIMRCLAKNPADRWQSADELVARLEGIASTPSGGLTPTDTRPFKATPARAAGGAGRKRAWLIGGIAAVAIAGAGAAAYALRGGGAGGRIQTIGVLPIQDISGKDSVFVTAMQDALINALLRANVAGVVSRAAVMQYAHTAKTTRQIADELRVGAVVEATAFRAGDVMRFNVQLTDPQTSRALWSGTYERDVRDVLAAQNDIVTRVAGGIDSVLAGPHTPGDGK